MSSGIREHRIYLVTFNWVYTYYRLDQDDNAVGETIREARTDIKYIVAPNKEAAISTLTDNPYRFSEFKLVKVEEQEIYACVIQHVW